MRTEPVLRPNDPFQMSPPPAPSRRGGWIVAALVTTVALLVAALGLAAWQTAAVGDRDDEIAALTDARDVALADAAAQADRVAVVTERVARLEARLEATTGDEQELARRLDDALATIERMLGPALPDGRHFAYVVAVGAAQDPPRIVIDVAQWFIDDAAVTAAIEDGRLPPGSTTIENGYYIRNEDPRWRVVEIDPATTVALTVFPYGDIGSPREVSLPRFEELFREDQRSAIRPFPYWFTVADGVITSIEQQFIP
jgi:hypothetical protein